MGERGLLWRILALACLLWFGADDLLAATATGSLTIDARITSHAKITLGANVINFVEFYHEHEDTIPANENPVAITAKARTGSNSTVNLTFLADGDLRSDHQIIRINSVTWTAEGEGYRNGTMSKITPQTVGTWTGPAATPGPYRFSWKTIPSRTREPTPQAASLP